MSIVNVFSLIRPTKIKLLIKPALPSLPPHLPSGTGHKVKDSVSDAETTTIYQICDSCPQMEHWSSLLLTDWLHQTFDCVPQCYQQSRHFWYFLRLPVVVPVWSAGAHLTIVVSVCPICVMFSAFQPVCSLTNGATFLLVSPSNWPIVKKYLMNFPHFISIWYCWALEWFLTLLPLLHLR